MLLRFKLVSRRGRNFFYLIRSCRQIFDKDAAIFIGDIFADYFPASLGNAQLRAGQGQLRVRIDLHQSQSGFRFVGDAHLFALAGIELHRDWLGIEDVALRGFDFLNDIGVDILIFKKNDPLIVRHVDLFAAGNIGLGNLELCADKGRARVLVNLENFKSGLRDVFELQLCRLARVYLDGMVRIVEQVSVGSHHLGNDVCALGHVLKDYLAVRSGNKCADGRAVGLLDLDLRPSKGFIRLGINFQDFDGRLTLVQKRQLGDLIRLKLNILFFRVGDISIGRGNFFYCIPSGIQI